MRSLSIIRATSLRCDPAVIEALLAGPRIEPLLHPKPGAVTRCREHRDKNVLDFATAQTPLEIAAYTTCIEASTKCRGSIAKGLAAYNRLHALMTQRVNINLGTLLLILPLSAAHGFTGVRKTRKLAGLAADVVSDCSGVEETREYYKLLRRLSPSHLGSYKGPVESVWSEPKTPFPQVLDAVSWDHVHREVLQGYPITLEMTNLMGSRESLEEGALYAMLHTLAAHGDTLVARKWGWRAYKVLLNEARWGLRMEAKWGLKRVLEILDRMWRPRGWNPGSVLDMLAIAIGFYIVEKLV